MVILLALFAFSATAGAAMSHCGQSHHSTDDTTSVEMASDCSMHTHATEADTTDQVKTDAGNNDLADTTACDDCDGSLCKTQTLTLSGDVEFNSCVSHDISSNIDLKSIYLTKIPAPPKQLS